jgi:integrase
MIKIQKEVLKDGTVRWRARGVSVGKDPRTGKRAQRTITRRTRKELEAELARLGVATSNGTYRAPWHGLVPEMLDSYLSSGAIEWEANTRLSYKLALLPAREWFAHRKARDVTREDVEAYRDHLRTSGRRRGGKAGTGLSPRSVNLSLQQLEAAYALAEKDGKVAVNPVRWVKRVKSEETDHGTWSADQVRRFIAAVSGDRLFAVWLLSLLGLRRGEVLGLKWSDISFTDGTITIARTRVLVDGKVVEKGPKSRRSARTLPLFPPLVAEPGKGKPPGVLEALYTAQLAEKTAAGAAYPADVDGNYICADELGAPLHPEHYSDAFHRIAGALPPIRLHDTRGSVNSYLERLGVPETLRARWLGHTIQINRSAYLGTPQPEELAVISDALGGLFKADVAEV